MNECRPPTACRTCKHAKSCGTWAQIQQRDTQQQPIQHTQRPIHSLRHIKTIPVRFRRSKHTEPIHYQARPIKIIRPYRVYRQQIDGVFHYEVRCEVCGRICKNIFGLPSKTGEHYYLGCPTHAIKPKYEQLFDTAWPKLQRFLDTTAISEEFIAKL